MNKHIIRAAEIFLFVVGCLFAGAVLFAVVTLAWIAHGIWGMFLLFFVSLVVIAFFIVGASR